MSDERRDPRPRPQFGEYATPEEQRARIQHPWPPASTMAEAVPAPAPPTPDGASRASASHPVDRVVTWALLLYGAVNVVLSVVSFLDLAEVADMTYRLMGIPGSFTETAATRGWGIAAAVVLVVGYALTVWLAVRTMRRGRLAWWIPVVGAMVTSLLVSVCVSVPLLADPAFLEYLGRG